MPVPITEQQRSALKSAKETLTPKVPQAEAPPEVMKMDFKMDQGLNLDSFEPEQLPEQESKEQKQEKALKPDSLVEKVSEEHKEEEAPTQSENKELEEQKAEEQKVEGEKKEETGVSKFLKPPQSKEQKEKAEKTVTEKGAEVVKKIDPTKGVSRDYTGF